MAANNGDIRYLTPPSVDVKRKILSFQKKAVLNTSITKILNFEKILERTGKILPRRLPVLR